MMLCAVKDPYLFLQLNFFLVNIHLIRKRIAPNFSSLLLFQNEEKIQDKGADMSLSLGYTCTV